MNLYKELLIHILSNPTVQVEFPHVSLNISEIIEGECYQILQEIKSIIDNEQLEDDECFLRIEYIMQSMENRGISFSNRHDF